MKTALTTNEHCCDRTSTWNSTPGGYDHHGYHAQHQYPHQYVDPQMSFDDSRRYRATSGRQYVVVPSASYSTTAADDTSGTGRSLDDHYYQPPGVDNVAAAGSYAPSGTGSAYSSACVDVRQLPDVVGGHVQAWTDQGVCSLQDCSGHHPG